MLGLVEAPPEGEVDAPPGVAEVDEPPEVMAPPAPEDRGVVVVVVVLEPDVLGLVMVDDGALGDGVDVMAPAPWLGVVVLRVLGVAGLLGLGEDGLDMAPEAAPGETGVPALDAGLLGFAAGLS